MPSRPMDLWCCKCYMYSWMLNSTQWHKQAQWENGASFTVYWNKWLCPPLSVQGRPMDLCSKCYMYSWCWKVHSDTNRQTGKTALWVSLCIELNEPLNNMVYITFMPSTVQNSFPNNITSVPSEPQLSMVSTIQLRYLHLCGTIAITNFITCRRLYN